MALRLMWWIEALETVTPGHACANCSRTMEGRAPAPADKIDDGLALRLRQALWRCAGSEAARSFGCCRLGSVARGRQVVLARGQATVAALVFVKPWR